MKDCSVQLGDTIRAIRIRKGLSLTHLTVKTGLSSPYLSQVEAGKNITFSNLIKIVYGLDCKLDEFFKEYELLDKKKDE